MNNKWNKLTSKQEQIVVLKAQIASINSFKPKKEHPMSHKKHNRKLDSIAQTRTRFTGNQAWRNKKPLPHETHVKVINGSI
jgi:hypothetical protein